MVLSHQKAPQTEKLSMPVKLFILGLPGSGKSAVARYICAKIYAESWHWTATRFNDYKILDDMFLQDTAERFKPAYSGGFDVLDLTVLDVALQRLEQQVKTYITSAKPEEIILIEFARNDYQKAFRQFNKAFLQDAYFLYLDVDLEICKRRIRERIAHPSTDDDFFVSEYIFSAYYYKDDGQYIPQILEGNYGIDKQRVMFIDNNGSLQDSTAQINQFVDIICGLESI